MRIGPGTHVGLVAHWKLDETEGLMAHDNAGQYHGTLCGGPQWTTGKAGGALQFDGLDDYVELPIGMVISALADCTLATWVSFSPGTGRDRRIFDFGRNSKVYMCLTASAEANGPVGFLITVLGNLNWRDDQTMTAYILRDGWHHLAVTIDARNKIHSLYLDGRIIARNAAAQFTPRDLGMTPNNWLGKAQYPGEHYFKGSLDDFRIYNRALSEAEVAQLAETTLADPKLLDWRALRDAASALQGALYGTASGTDDAVPVGAAVLLCDTGWSEPVGTWDPATRTAILTQDLNETIQIDSNGITLEGNGHKVTGRGAGDGDAGYWGVRAYRKNNLTIKNLRVSRFYRGVCLNACRDSTVADNVCSNNYVGVTVWGRSTNNTVAANTCSNNRDGIWIYYSNGNNIAGNHILDNQYCGIWIYYSCDNRVVSNDVSNNKHDGIWLYCSEENGLTENLSAGNGHSGIRLDSSSQNTLAANTTSSNASEGTLLMSSSSNTLADNRALLNNHYGIMLGDSNDNSLTGNTASGNNRGIGLALSNHNKLASNTASDNQDCGIGVLNECRNNSLANNTASGNATGLYLAYCNANAVVGNTVTSNKTNGIWIRSVSLDNTVTGNTVANNAVGVRVSGGGRNNAVCNNNFIDNQAQTSISPTTTDNLFSLGRPIGGNFWSDWTGPDADGDGFVDRPYAFKHGQDNLPWTVRDGWASKGGSTTGSAVMMPTTGTACPDPNLVGWWKLDEGSGVTAYDSSGHGNNGILYGGPRWVAGKIGNALHFDGTDDGVDCPNSASLDITGPITLAAWVKTEDSGDGRTHEYIVKGHRAYALRHQRDNVMEFMIFDGLSFYNARRRVNDSFNGAWHHLAGAYDGRQLRLYIGGWLQASSNHVDSPHVGSIASSTVHVGIGCNMDDPSLHFNGAIDDARIYSRALTDAEVAHLARPAISDPDPAAAGDPNPVAPRDPNLVGPRKQAENSER
jgi:parallel beta-helix repeat protein